MIDGETPIVMRTRVQPAEMRRVAGGLARRVGDGRATRREDPPATQPYRAPRARLGNVARKWASAAL